MPLWQFPVKLASFCIKNPTSNFTRLVEIKMYLVNLPFISDFGMAVHGLKGVSDRQPLALLSDVQQD